MKGIGFTWALFGDPMVDKKGLNYTVQLENMGKKKRKKSGENWRVCIFTAEMVS